MAYNKFGLFWGHPLTKRLRFVQKAFPSLVMANISSGWGQGPSYFRVTFRACFFRQPTGEKPSTPVLAAFPAPIFGLSTYLLVLGCNKPVIRHGATAWLGTAACSGVTRPAMHPRSCVSTSTAAMQAFSCDRSRPVWPIQ